MPRHETWNLHCGVKAFCSREDDLCAQLTISGAKAESFCESHFLDFPKKEGQNPRYLVLLPVEMVGDDDRREEDEHRDVVDTNEDAREDAERVHGEEGRRRADGESHGRGQRREEHSERRAAIHV